jgi:hypothetical protein
MSNFQISCITLDLECITRYSLLVILSSGFYLVLPTKTIFTSHYSVDNVFYCSQDTTHISTRHVHNIYGRISAACCPVVSVATYTPSSQEKCVAQYYRYQKRSRGFGDM